MDRDIYKKNMQDALNSPDNANLEIYEGSVHDLMIEGGECKGIVM